jgi:4-hydroxythreonine-4-phosphate dehydrogenase
MIKSAVNLVKTGKACALTTNPIHKKALQDGAGFAFPGHTEFLGELGNIPCPVMMLSAPELRVVPVTIHIALNQVKTALTPALLEQTIRVTHAAMIADLNISAPRIAVAGLNPHAGEGGAMGGDEITLIRPVLDRLRLEGLDLRGPIPADTMFHGAARETYDLALCMYHDQALIPLKTLNFAAGVNTTLGLPFIRTSPDHGTAFDIAGTGRADPTSLKEALRAAWRMAKTRGTR